MPIRTKRREIASDPAGTAGMAVFFTALRRGFADGLAKDELLKFFDALRECKFSDADRKAAARPHPDACELASWLSALGPPLKKADEAGLFGDPWVAAGLGRNEVRNAKVLKWFLDPRAAHGCGETLLVDLLDHVRSRLPYFPKCPSRVCSVTAENWPDGDISSRVDIQIDDPAFFLLVEVKIDAAEQPSQMERYCEDAAARTCGMRPWAAVFLTPSGRPSETAGGYGDHVIELQWSSVAAALRLASRKSTHDASTQTTAAIPRFLASTFARHIAQF